ncbi:hypothetical protein [Flavobacterium sp. FlaQc-30]|uniref:hypothetical protein n=1 Tax=Flavobacterium sp. FlaQc-30 TaxID=3374179 RepID=UPI003757D666
MPEIFNKSWSKAVQNKCKDDLKDERVLEKEIARCERIIDANKQSQTACLKTNADITKDRLYVFKLLVSPLCKNSQNI